MTQARAEDRFVRGVFTSVARRYDLMNDLMSGGVHRCWKDAMVRRLDPRPGERVLDVAGGTGDVAFRIRDRMRASGARDARGEVVVCDATEAMLRVGRDRAVDSGRVDGLRWLGGDAQALPLPDGSVDAYTIAFGLRNVTDIDAALREARRVLRPGGRVLCLEFSQVAVPGFDRLYAAYSDAVLPRLGAAVAGDRASYRYLVDSIRRFPDQHQLAARMRAAGLASVRHTNLMGGIAALHRARRP
jgi:demethylmenaquinone methyltransferase/2-methoxy-6-polyprenyl-1,4-benzoquinol methylase